MVCSMITLNSLRLVFLTAPDIFNRVQGMNFHSPIDCIEVRRGDLGKTLEI